MSTIANMQWNASLYDDKHAFVSEYGKNLVSLLAPKAGETILDLGCGTGDLTKEIAESGANVTGVDSSKEMVDEAKIKYPDITFEVMNGAELSLATGFDAVFSNAALHWMLRKEDVIAGVAKALKPGGRFVAEMGGKDNVRDIINAVKEVLAKNGYTENAGRQLWYFPSPAEYSALLEKAGFEVRYLWYYNRPTKLMDDKNGIIEWLQMFGAGYFADIPASEKEQLLKQIQECMRPTNYKNGEWWAGYKRLCFVAEKQQ